MKLEHAISVADVRGIAQRRLPRFVFDIIETGAGDEITLRSNEAAFRAIQFRPRPFADVHKRDLSTTVLGDRISMPLMLAPTGASRGLRREAELAIARAAGDAGTVYVQSTVSSFELEDVARAATGALWFQLYLPPTRELTHQLLARVAQAGYRTLAITIDSAVIGNRERDLHNRITPLRIWRPDLFWQALRRPRWTAEFLRGNVGPGRWRSAFAPPAMQGARRVSLSRMEAQMYAAQRPVTWADLRVVRELWAGPLVVKGLMRSDDCERLVSEGVNGVIVSNHGGRQLDGLPATLDVLPSVVEAIRGRAEVFVDGGIRRGSDVVKAIALGAKACLVGRPYLYGLAAGGEAGVTRVLELLRADIDRTMALLGCSTVRDIDRTLVVARGAERTAP